MSGETKIALAAAAKNPPESFEQFGKWLGSLQSLYAKARRQEKWERRGER